MPAPAKPSAPQVLLVDDDVILTFDLEVNLIGAGFEVCGVARNAQRGLRLAQTRHPDVIVMDVNLAGRADGVTAAIMMRTVGINAPIVFLTGHGDAATRNRAAAIENSWFITKPLVPDVLGETLREALGQPG